MHLSAYACSSSSKYLTTALRCATFFSRSGIALLLRSSERLPPWGGENLRVLAAQSLIVRTMWNRAAPSSLLLPFGDDSVKCEASNSPAGTVGFDKMLATDYGLCHHMSFSPSFQSLQSPTLFSTRSSESNLEIGGGSIYNGDARPSFAQFSYTQPITATHLVKWTAAGEPLTGEGSSFRGSKRLKITATATTQGPQHRLQCSAKTRNQPMKAPCKRSQKLGDKITELQQLVSPYGKTDTASVLHEAATCIRGLHEQIQILTAPYPGIGSSEPQQDTGEEGAADLRQRGLCLAPLSPAIVNLVSEAVRSHRHSDMVDRWFEPFGAL